MKSFINEKGELEQHPENLEDQLALKSPELSAKLDSIKDWKANLMLYRDFLYIFPDDNEVKLPVEQRTRINNCIDYAHNQVNLRGIIKSLEFMKHTDRNLIGDKVMILHSDRPLWDSVVEPVNDYTGKGWIGKLQKYAIIDPLNPAYESGQNKILRQIELTDAVELAKEDMRIWVLERITNIIFHDFYDGIDGAIKRFDKMPSGKETIRITDNYENLDYVVIKHKQTPEEAEAAKLPYEARFNTSSYFPPISQEAEFPTDRWFKDLDYRDYISRFETSTGRWYGKGDSNYQSAFLGEDSRDILEIYEDLAKHLNHKKGLQIFVGKQLVSKLTKEQEDFINRQPSGDRDVWRNKFFTEQGLELKTKTGINIFFYSDRKDKEEKYQAILSKAAEFLAEKGYEFNGTFGYGIWGRSNPKYVDFSDIAHTGCYIGYSKGI
jgi:hypothetical protein